MEDYTQKSDSPDLSGTSARFGEFDDLIPLWFEAVKVIIAQKEEFSPLNKGEGAALLLLANSAHDLSAGELSAALGISTGRTANILHQLENKGFVERTILDSNRRKTKISLTKAGNTHATEAFERAQKKAAEVLQKLGREDAEELIRILKKLALPEQTGPLKQDSIHDQ